MKILALGDPHFMNGNLYFMRWACHEIFELIDQQQPDLVVCLGDTLHEHERIGMMAQTMAIKFFFEIANRCRLIVIIGNHDRANATDFLSENHSMVGLLNSPNITVVDHVIWDRKLNFIYVPYVAPGRFEEALATVGYSPRQHNPQGIYSQTGAMTPGNPVTPMKGSRGHGAPSAMTPIPEIVTFNSTVELPSIIIESPKALTPDISSDDFVENSSTEDEGEIFYEHPRLIFAHQEFKGSHYNSTTGSKKGDPWSDQWPLVVSGHIHKYQLLPGIIYTGTFYQENYGEDPDKAVMMLDLGDNPEQIENLNISRIRLTSICPRVTVHLNMDELNNFHHKIPVDSIRSRDYKKSTGRVIGTLVRVMLHVDAAQTKTLHQHPHYMALEKMVDTITTIPECDRASLARAVMPAATQEEIEQFSLEDMVREMIRDDPETLALFENEII